MERENYNSGVDDRLSIDDVAGYTLVEENSSVDDRLSIDDVAGYTLVEENSGVDDRLSIDDVAGYTLVEENSGVDDRLSIDNVVGYTLVEENSGVDDRLSIDDVVKYQENRSVKESSSKPFIRLYNVRSDDGLYCLTCLSPLIYTGGTCTGCEDQTSIFVDTIPINHSSTGDRRCQTCPASTIADSSKKLCIPCGISNCSNCLSFTNGVCFTQPLTPPTSTPFPFYSNFSSSLALCNSSSILPIYAARFALNGTFLDLSLVNDTIMLCKDRPSKMAAAWQVGVHYEIQCSLDPIALMTDGSSPIFYDIYIKDGNMLVPIPVLISGHRDNNGVLVNEGDDSSQWQFVRRFYTHQSVTGTPSYLESTEINIQLTSRGHIQSPYLRLSYQPIPSNDAQASFVVRYSGGNNAFNIALLVIASVFVILAAVYAGLKVNGTYFVANEWNEIQTHRKLNSFFVLMLSLLFLEIIGLGNLAERNPSINVTTPTERYTAPHSSVLRIGLAVIVYLLIAGISVREGKREY
uniref:Uncharacterized protein n=1 Tax=Amphimedon queenslandica TaxID=400682 RepID=A0A1X7TXY7_AMPQE